MAATLFFVWLTISLFFLIIELAGVSFFFFLSFSLAALFAAVTSLFDISFAVQLLIFLSLSIVCIFFLRYRFNPTRIQSVATNVQALVGEKGAVIKTIAPGISGQVKMKGEIWPARSLSHELIIEGNEIQVVDIKGNHLIVKRAGKAPEVET